MPPAAPLRRGGVCRIVAHALLTFATRVPSLRSPELFFSSHFGGKVLLRKKNGSRPIPHRWHATYRSINGVVTIRAFTASLHTYPGLAGREFHQRLFGSSEKFRARNPLFLELLSARAESYFQENFQKVSNISGSFPGKLVILLEFSRKIAIFLAEQGLRCYQSRAGPAQHMLAGPAPREQKE